MVNRTASIRREGGLSIPNRRYKTQVLRRFPDARIKTYMLPDQQICHQVFTPRQLLGFGATRVSAWKAAWLRNHHIIRAETAPLSVGHNPRSLWRLASPIGAVNHVSISSAL
jgi:hypothetical protein